MTYPTAPTGATRPCLPLAHLLTAARAGDQRVCVTDADPAGTSANPSAMDWQDWRDRTLAVAAHLNTQAGSRVALCLDDPFDMACALFATWAAGKTPVILPNTLAQTRETLAFAYDLTLEPQTLTALDTSVRADAPASLAPTCEVVLYTSGSTGEPKAIVKTLAQLDGEVQVLHRHWGARLADALLVASVPCHHVYGLWFRVLWPLAAGTPFVRQTFTEPSQAGAWRHWPKVVWIAGPAQLTRWPDLIDTSKHGWRDMPATVFSSGGPLPAPAAQQFAVLARQRHGEAATACAPIEVYGSTETGGIAWRQQDAGDAWTPLGDVALRIEADGALSLLSPRVDAAQWYRTDDGARLLDNGTFMLTGRLDRIVKIEGKRVALPAVEAALMTHPYVRDAATVELDGRLAAAVALSPEGITAWRTSSLREVRHALRDTLAAQFDATLLPRRWRFAERLPLNERGKRTVASVAALFEQRSAWLPVVLGQYRDNATLGLSLRVPTDLPHFAGHFPGLPILPGVVLLDWAARLTRDHAHDAAAWMAGPSTLINAKFSAPVAPGSLLDLTLTLDADRRRVQYAWQGRRGAVASGTLSFGDPQ